MSPQARIIVQIEAIISWKVARDPDSDSWIGVCDPLNLVAHGETFGDMQACANEAMEALFDDLFEDNELAAFLRKNGWTTAATLPYPGTTPRFDVPSRWGDPAPAGELLQPA